MDRSHAVISSEGQQIERRGGGGGGNAGRVDARKEASSSSSAWKQGNPRIVHPSVTSPISTSTSTFSNLTSNLTTRFSTFVASPSSTSNSTTSPRLDSSSPPGSVPSSAFPSSTEGISSSSSSTLVWSAFDDLPSSYSSTEMVEGGGLQGRTSSRVLLKASSQELSIWSAPDSPSGAAKELVRISGKGRLEWGGGSSQIVGAKILGGGESKMGALRVVILLDSVDSSALVVHSLETLEVLDSTTLTGQAGELKATESFIVVSTTSPSQLHILSSTTLAPHSAPITTVAINPTTNKPTFTLSHRFLSYASSFAPPKSMPLIVRLGGNAGEPAGVIRRREPTLSPSKVVGTLGGLILGGPGGSKTRGRDQGAGVEGTLVDVAGRFVSGGAAAGREGMRKVGNLVAGFAGTSVSTATTASTSEAAPTSPSPPSPPPFPLDRTYTTHQPSRLPPRPSQDNSIAVVDLLSSNPTTPIIHFYLQPSASPTREQVSFLSLSPSGRELLVALSPSSEFNVLEIRPKGRGSTLTAGGGEVWERYRLKRGVTPGVVRGVEWEGDETGVGVLSGRGTIHVYLLNPQGGSPQGHLHGKVVNSKLLVPLSTIVQPIIQVRPQGDSTQVFNNNASRTHRRTSSSDFAPLSNTSSPTFTPPPTNFFFLPTAPPSLLHSPKPSTTSGRRLSSPSHNHQHLPPLPTPSIAKDLLIFEPGRDGLRLHRTVLGAKVGSSSSGLSLMLSQTGSVAGGGGRVSKEVVVLESEATMARWELGGTGDEGGEVRMGKKPHGSSSSAVSPRRRDASSSSTDQDRARWLSHVEIETSSSSFKILPSPIWLSPQFEFHVYDTTSSLPDFSPRQLGSLVTDRLIVRNEVQVSSSSSNQLSSLSTTQVPSLSIPSSFTNSSAIGSPAFSLERFPSSSSRRSSSSHSHSQSFGPGSFDASLETAIHTSLGPLHPRSRSIVPSYPNGDGPTTSPRSWKSTTVPLAGLLGEGMDRFRKEVGRVSSSTTTKPRSTAPSSSSLPNQASFNVLSFEEGTIYDENDFASARSSGGGGKFSSSSAEGSGPSTSSFEEEQWEEEDDPEEAYRKVIAEEEEYEDLIVGVMDDVGGGGDGRVVEAKVEVEKKVELEVERELQVAREEQQETVRPKKKGENEKRGKVSTSPMGSVGEEMKHSEVGSGKE